MAGVVAVIPARGGSKGIPRKNVQPLAGKPLIAHTISAAQQAACIDRVIVSTEDEEIARIAQGCGAEVVMRPSALATDDAPTEAALLHVVEELTRRGDAPEVIVTLEPTSPLRPAGVIDRCVALLLESGADSVLSVVESRACFGRIEGGVFRFLDDGQPRRRQLREPWYKEAGGVYATRTASLRAHQSVVRGTLRAVVINEQDAVDINTLDDLRVAEALIERALQQGGRR